MLNSKIKLNFEIINNEENVLGIIAKEGSRNAIIMYFGAILGAVNTILLYPNILPEEGYGLISTMTSIAILVAGLSGVGSTASIIKFLPFYRDKETRSNGGILKYLFLLCLGISSALAVVMILLKEWLQKPFEDSAELLVDFYYLIIPLFMINLMIDLFSNYANGLFKTNLQMFQKEVFLRLGQTFLIALFYLKVIDLTGFVVGYVLMYAISLIILLVYLYKLGELSIAGVESLKKADRRKVLKFGGLTFFSSLASSFAFRMDTLMLGAMLVSIDDPNVGLVAVAIYTVALSMASMIEMPFRAMNQIVNPSISQAWKDNDLAKVEEVYTKSTETMVIVGAFIFLGIWLCIDDIVAILPDKFANVEYVFFWLGMGKFFNVACGSNGQVLINSPKYQVYTFFTVVGLVFTFVSNYYLIGLYETEGAALATAITYFFINLAIFLYLYLKYRFQPFNWSNLQTIMLSAAIYFLLFKLDTELYILNILIKATITTVVFWFVVVRFNFSPDISKMFKSTLAKFKR